MKRRLFLTVVSGLVLFASVARASFSFNWSAPSSVNVGEGYTVAVEAYFAPNDYSDSYAVLGLYRDGSQVGGGSTGPYGWASTSNSFNDGSPQTISYSADIYSYYGESDYSSHSVTVNGAPANNPPSAWVTVDGYGHGATITRPYGGSVDVTVRYKASDPDNNLARIRPQVWYPSGGLNNNGGNFIGQSGGYGEVVWTVTLNENGSWHFWTDAEDTNNVFVNSGAWTDGFRIDVVEGAPPNSAPSVTLLAPGAQTIASGTNLTLTGQATDPDGNLAEHNLDIQRPDGNWNWYGGFAYGEPYMGGPVGSAANSTRSANFTFDQVGTWYVRSYGRDSAGASVHSATVAITVVQANQAPTGTVRVNTTSITTGQQVVVSVDATDANGNLHYINIDQTSPTNGFYGPGDTGTETPPNNGAYSLGGYFGSRTRDLTLTLNTPGTYVFRGAMNDDSGWYYTPNTVSVTVGNAGQGSVGISPGSGTLTAGQSLAFTASGGSGSGDYVWGGDASGTGSSKTVTFNTAGSRTVTVYRAASAGYNQSNTASATITVNAPDTTPPGPPMDLQISGLTATGFTASWRAPGGESVAGYRVRIDNGSFLDVNTNTSHAFSGLAAGSSHLVDVQVRDLAGNWSASTSAGVTTGGNSGSTQTAGSVWRDLNGDGILDEVVRPGSAAFDYYINQWYTTNTYYWTYSINDYWYDWDTRWHWADSYQLYTGFSWLWSGTIFWIGYEAHFELVFSVEVNANEPFSIYRDTSGSHEIYPANWGTPLFNFPNGVSVSGVTRLPWSLPSANDLPGITGAIGRLSPKEFVVLLKELDRRIGKHDEGTIGTAINAYASIGGKSVAMGVILEIIETTETSRRLRLELLRTAGTWTELSDIRAVQETVNRLSNSTQPNDEIPVDYGIARLLEKAVSVARREGNQTQASAIIEIASVQASKALPDLVKGALHDNILKAEGVGSMKILSSYRHVLGSTFDEHLIKAFAKAGISLRDQILILDRVAEWSPEAPYIGNFARGLLMKHNRDNIGISPAELAILEKLGSKYPPVSAGNQIKPSSRPESLDVSSKRTSSEPATNSPAPTTATDTTSESATLSLSPWSWVAGSALVVLLLILFVKRR